MTSNDAQNSAGGRPRKGRRALGRGPGGIFPAARHTPFAADPGPGPATAADDAPPDAGDAPANAGDVPGNGNDVPAKVDTATPPEGDTTAPDAHAAPAPDAARVDTATPAYAGTTATADTANTANAANTANTANTADTADTADTAAATPAGTGAPDEQAATEEGVFTVRLSNFEGPFDLLLQLISRHKLDVTEVALSKVTDEFMAHIRAMGPDWDLDQTTEFLVVAATLLDLKAARLLPAAEVEDEADLALLEARDLLFARLLQYRAYKQIADIFTARLDDEARRYPRTVGLEPHHAELLPEVVISIGAEGFAKLAVKAMQPRPAPQVYVDHIHAPLVSVVEQAQVVMARLREAGEASFRALIEDAGDTLTVVARFLALLELYREKAVGLDQEDPLGELIVRWTGGDGETRPTVTDEFDRGPAKPEEDEAAGRRGARTASLPAGEPVGDR